MQAFNYDVENLYYCDVVEKIYCYVYDFSVSLFASHASHSLSNVVSGHRKHQIGSSGHEIIKRSSRHGASSSRFRSFRSFTSLSSPFFKKFAEEKSQFPLSCLSRESIRQISRHV